MLMVCFFKGSSSEEALDLNTEKLQNSCSYVTLFEVKSYPGNVVQDGSCCDS